MLQRLYNNDSLVIIFTRVDQVEILIFTSLSSFILIETDSIWLNLFYTLDGRLLNTTAISNSHVREVDRISLALNRFANKKNESKNLTSFTGRKVTRVEHAKNEKGEFSLFYCS